MIDKLGRVTREMLTGNPQRFTEIGVGLLRFTQPGQSLFPFSLGECRGLLQFEPALISSLTVSSGRTEAGTYFVMRADMSVLACTSMALVLRFSCRDSSLKRLSTI
ncbi:hypothetical protein EVA_05925 [gut metagenome]|uniref:Uncharacterized protein n=1 Tax=gut metagenome TaxID=749906 RepID=J9GGA2_9ZZZZ